MVLTTNFNNEYFFFNDLKTNKYIFGECILEVTNVLTNIFLLFFVLKIVNEDNDIYKFINIYIILFINVFFSFLLFMLQKRKQILHGYFKDKIRKTFIKIIFNKKNIGSSIHTGEFATDLWMGVEWLGVYYFEALPNFVSKLLILSLIIIYMFFINMKVALLLVFSVVMVVIIEKIFAPFISQASKKESLLNEKYSKMSIEALKGAETLKSLNAVNLYQEKLRNEAKLLKKTSMKFVCFTTLSKGVKDTVLILIKITSLIIILNNFIRYGKNIDSILISIFLIFIFYMKINSLHGSFLKVSKSKIYKEKINSYIKSYKESVENENAKENNVTSEYTIYAKNLSFEYPQKKSSVLRNINLCIQPGKKIAFIGESGSGKSTIIKCLGGFLKEFKGNVCIFGLDISNKDNLKKVKKNMSVIWQKNHIFNETVFENVRIAKKNASENEVIEALKQANIYKFITTLPNDIYTYIGDGGYELSGGQKSRIAIARAFLRNSSLILLDEPTSELDRENESEIISNLRKLFKGKTVLQTAHRLETIKDFDLICYVKNGQIIYSGNHEDLLLSFDEYRNYFEKIKSGT